MTGDHCLRVEDRAQSAVQELDADEGATLKALQRVSKLLTDEVIPKLEKPVDHEDTDTDAFRRGAGPTSQHRSDRLPARGRRDRAAAELIDQSA